MHNVRSKTKERMQGLPDLLGALPAELLSRADLNLAVFCWTNADVHRQDEDPRPALSLLAYSPCEFCLILHCRYGRGLKLLLESTGLGQPPVDT